MQIPNFEQGPLVKEDLYLEDNWRTVLMQLFAALQTNLSDEGFILPQQSTSNITLIASGSTTPNTWYDTTTNQVKVNFNGTVKPLQAAITLIGTTNDIIITESPTDTFTFSIGSGVPIIASPPLSPNTIIGTDNSSELISTSGTADQILGMNHLANGFEYKTISGTTHQVGVAQAANSITLSTPQDIGLLSSPSFSSLTSTVTTGTQPYACISTTLNTNLNADFLDGNHGSYFDNQIHWLQSSGVITPFVFTITSPTTFSIASNTLQYIDNFTDPNNPTRTIVTVPGQSNITPIGLGASIRTLLYWDCISLTLYQSITYLSQEESRTKIYIGIVIHSNGMTIDAINCDAFYVAQQGQFIPDVLSLLMSNQIQEISSIKYWAHGSDLKLKFSVYEALLVDGEVLSVGAGPAITRNIITVPAVDPIPLLYLVYFDSFNFPQIIPSDSVDPNNYRKSDGTLDSVPSGYWTAQRLYYFPGSGERIVAYGINVYASDRLAIQGYLNEDWTAFINSPAVSGAFFAGYLIIKQGTTDLSNTTMAIFSDKDNPITVIPVDVVNRGIISPFTITDLGGINISWSDGVIYDVNNKVTVNIVSSGGSVACTNNAINYLYWNASGNTLTLNTSKPYGGMVIIARIFVQDNDIYAILQKDTLTDREANLLDGTSEIFPTVVTSGLLVNPDPDVTNPFDVLSSAGVYYEGLHKEIIVPIIYSRITPMVRHFHSGGAWSSDTNAQIDNDNYDNGTNVVAMNNNYYAKGMFIIDGTRIHWIYPQAQHTNVANAIAAALPIIPPGIVGLVRSMAYVQKRGDTTFVSTSDPRWINLTSTIGSASSSGIINHDDLSLIRLAGETPTITYGHINYLTQSIYGAKTFIASTMALSNSADSVDFQLISRGSAGDLAGISFWEGATKTWDIQSNVTGKAISFIRNGVGTYPFVVSDTSVTAVSAQISNLTPDTIVSCNASRYLQSLSIGANLTLSGNVLSANINAAIGQAISYYFDDTSIVAKTTENDFEINTLASSPVTSTPEVIDTTAVSSATSPVFMEAFETPLALGRTSLQAGAWIPKIYAKVSAIGGNSEVLTGIYLSQSLSPITVTMTGTGTTRTCTASSTIFSAGMANANKTLCWYIRTSKGAYQISAYASGTEVTITVPTGYINESAVTLIFWEFILNSSTFGAFSTYLTTTLTLYASTSSFGSVATGLTDKLVAIIFAKTTSVPSVNVSFTHNGSTNYSFVQTPLITRHDDEAEIHNIGSGITYGHVSDGTETFYGLKTFNSVVSSTAFTSTVATGTPPFTATSTTQCTNLNAALCNGYSFNQALQTSNNPNFNSLSIGATAGSTTKLISLNSAANQEVNISFLSAGIEKWKWYRPVSSNDLRLYDSDASLDFIRIVAGGMYIGNDSYSGGVALYLNSVAASDTILAFQSAGTYKWNITRPTSSNNLHIDEMVGGTTATTRMSFATGGFVGIGIENPGTLLHIKATGDSVFSISGGSGNLSAINLYSTTTLKWQFGRLSTSHDFFIYNAVTTNSPFKMTAGDKVYLPTIYNNNVGAVRAVMVKSDGELGYNASTLISKNIIEENPDISDLYKIRTFLCTYKDMPESGTWVSPIADYCVNIFNGTLCTYNNEGDLDGFAYPKLDGIFIQALKNHKLEIDSLKERIRIVEQKIN